jgi:putative peptidoglycan lipid II flippase
MLRGFLTVGGWTMASRVLGFVRDILIARFLGTSAVAEAFLIAFSLPNMFRRFFAEGAFNMAFVPMYAKKLEAGEGADDFARDAFTGMFVILSVFSVLGVVFMPALVWAMASGFAEDERFSLAVFYGRIAFPYILMISLAALISGLLNANRRFLAAAAAPVLLNVIFIVGMVGMTIFASSAPSDIGLALAWSVPLGGLAQLGLVYWAARRAGHVLRLRRPQMTPELKRLAIIAAPAALAGGVMQVNLLVGRQVASYFEGAVAWLAYADRLYQLPLGVVGIAIGVVLLPELARRVRASDEVGGQHALSRAGEFALLLTIPAAVALVVMSVPLVSILFERGAFGSDDTASTALALIVYGAGLPAFVMQKVFQPLYFAREDTKSPLRYAFVALIINALVAVGLAPFIGFIAAALGTTLAAWGMLWFLWRGSRGMGQAAQFDRQFKTRIWRIVLAAITMGIVLWFAELSIGPMLGQPGWRYLGLAILVIIGLASYAVAGQLFGAFRLRDLRASLRRV